MRKKRSEHVKTDKKQVAKDILSHILDHPGVHFNNLCRALKIAPGTIQYHLNKMEQRKEVIVLRKEYKTLYFPPTMADPIDQKIMMLLRQQIPRLLLLTLLEDTDKTGHELTRVLKITKSTLSYYISLLQKLEILTVKIKGREKRYIIEQPERIARLLTEYKKSFSDKLVDRFVEIWVRI